MSVDLMGQHLWQGLTLGSQAEVLGHVVPVHRPPKRCLLPRCFPHIQARPLWTCVVVRRPGLVHKGGGSCQSAAVQLLNMMH